jgi:TonB-linked SusC/RagA family outer membrane protein
MQKKITYSLLNRFITKARLRTSAAVLLTGFPVCIPAYANAGTVKQILHVTQEQVKVTGTVSDENGQPIAGVSIAEKATRKGTVTDANGKYTLMVERGATLTVSFVGYITYEASVNGSGTINVQLKPQANMLNQVVAIGYQTMRKSDVTGAISSVKANELNLSTPTVGQALVGKVAGVQVSQVSGAPYQSTKIRVRGVGSINASSDPLYVIDGYPAGNDVFINPQDIESIDILKDAASAAIYGSRGASGVVLITTKRGKDGKGRFEYDYQTGINQLSRKIPLLDANGFAQLIVDGRNNTYRDLWENAGKVWNNSMYGDNNSTRITNVGNASSVSIPTNLYDLSTQQIIPQTINTDWQDELYRNAIFKRHSLAFSGGNKDVKYYLSGGYQDQPGIILHTGQKRINLRSNIDGDVNTRLHVGANISFTQNTNREIQEGRYDHSPVMSALIYLPYLPAYNADGSTAQYGMASLASAFGVQNPENPITQVEKIKINRRGQRGTYNANATYKIIPDLAFKVNVGMQTYNEKYDYYRPTSISNGNDAPGSTSAINAATATAQNLSQVDQLAEFTLNYKKELGKHHFDALAGYSAQKTTSDLISVSATGFQNDYVPEITAKGADAGFFRLNDGSGKSAYTLVSYFGRVTYNFDSRYFLTGSFRTDGSSRFGPLNRWGSFPSVSAGWNMSEESFYHSWLGEQSTVKLRASWGLSGNNNIGNYNSVRTLNNPTGVVFGNNSLVSTAVNPGNFKDPKIGWESTSQFNFGADFGLLKGRLSVIANYYLSYSYNLLFDQPVSALAGTTSIRTNLIDSKVRNTGFDIQADARVIAAKDFRLNVSGNIALNRNKVLNMGGSSTIISAGAERSYKTHITEEGQPIGMFYGLKVGGIVTPENINTVPRSAASTNPLRVGDLYFVDKDGNGVVNDNDKDIIGTPYADFTYGFNVNSSHKNIDFSASFNGSKGNQILDGQDYYIFNMEGSGNQYAVVADRYRSALQPGNGEIYRASRGGTQSNSTRLSSFYLQDGSYLRCTNLTLGYTLPKLLNGKLGISKARIFVAVDNAFTITKYKGYNPDVDYNYSFSGSTGANLTPGVDYGLYPLVRAYNLGVKLTF